MKYKQLAEEREKELKALAREMDTLRLQLDTCSQGFVAQASADMESEEAREILRIFASKASDRHELVLLVRALAKLPA